MGSGRQGDHAGQVGRPLDPATTPRDVQTRAMFCNDMSEAAAGAFVAGLGEDHWPMDVLTRKDWRYDHLREMPATYILCERDQALRRLGRSASPSVSSSIASSISPLAIK